MLLYNYITISFQEEHVTETENTNKRKADILDESVTKDNENLLILKRVAEIKEAPESLAKKKHEAQLSLKAKQMKKGQMKPMPVSPKSPDSNVSLVSPKLQLRKIEELTKPQAKTNLERHSPAMRLETRIPQRIRKVRVLTQAEVEKIRKHSKAQFRKIRVVSQSQLNKLQDSQLKIVEPKSELPNLQNGVEDLSADTPKHISLPAGNIKKEHHKMQAYLEAERLPINPKRYQKYENFMNNTIAYFDRISRDFDKKVSPEVSGLYIIFDSI